MLKTEKINRAKLTSSEQYEKWANYGGKTPLDTAVEVLHGIKLRIKNKILCQQVKDTL